MSVIAIIIAPALGFMVDKIGHKVTFIWTAQVLLIISHILFLSIPSCDGDCYWRGVPPILLMGIAYWLIYVWVWPSIPLIVRPEMIGYAYGMAISMHKIYIKLKNNKFKIGNNFKVY